MAHFLAFAGITMISTASPRCSPYRSTAACNTSSKSFDPFDVLTGPSICPGVSVSFPIPYKVEPYVVAADVYAVQPHSGLGGWTWYTGAAGWMYRLLTEYILGDRICTAPVESLKRGEILALRDRIRTKTTAGQANKAIGALKVVLENMLRFEEVRAMPVTR